MAPERFERRFTKYYETTRSGSVSLLRPRQPVGGTGRDDGSVPDPLRVAGQLLPAAIGGDFAVDEDHRGFGPAVALQRATTSVLLERNLKCAYGSPNSSSEPIVGRAGYADVGRLTRFVKLLTARPFVDRYIRRPRLARLASRGRSAVSVLSRERLHRSSARFSIDLPEPSTTACDPVGGRSLSSWCDKRAKRRPPQLEIRETAPVEAKRTTRSSHSGGPGGGRLHRVPARDDSRSSTTSSTS